MMHTKLTIALGVMAAALFVLVPKAVSKKVASSSQALIPHCASVGGADICTLTVTDLSARPQYKLEVVATGCHNYLGGVIYINTFSAAQLAAGISTGPIDDGGCGTSTWTFNLYSLNPKNLPSSSLVGSGSTSDSD